MISAIPSYDLYGESGSAAAQFWVHCETIPSRSSLHHFEIGMHRHVHFFQILSILSGSGDAIFGDRVVRFEPPAMITIPPGVAHGFRFAPDIDGHVFTILSGRLPARPDEPSPIGRFLAEPRVTCLDDTAAPAIRSTLNTVLSEWAGRRSQWAIMVEAGIASTLALTARAAALDVREAQGGDENDRRMEILSTLVQREVRNHRPASYFASALGISPTHLNRIVKVKTGLSTQAFLAERLLEEAQRALLFTGGSVQDVAFRLGFSDPAYFSRFFLRQTGVTPRAWRLQEQPKLGAREEGLGLNHG
ncbi:helix-turn-helix domain-containing protein [Rhizobium sp. G187]|uniref:helix-turn-helix domain-containing protein n=1 Tax=Rhizobium sp. G187 TaxID=3451352 RepID=UPI003EE51966